MQRDLCPACAAAHLC